MCFVVVVTDVLFNSILLVLCIVVLYTVCICMYMWMCTVSIVIVSFIFVYVVCICSGAEERHFPSTGVETINQSINQSINQRGCDCKLHSYPSEGTLKHDITLKYIRIYVYS